MSKSKGNFFTARDLFAKGIEPAALRLELIKTDDLIDEFAGAFDDTVYPPQYLDEVRRGWA